MYSIDYLSQIWDSVERKIYSERLNYNHLYEGIEEYMSRFNTSNSKNAIMIGGSTGISVLLEKERTIHDFVYDLYAEDAFIHANDLTNYLEEINEKSDTSYIIYLKTTIPNVKYQIVIDNRVIVFVYKLSENSYNLIMPVPVKTFDKKRNILAVSPEIQLLDIYRTLYSPNMFDEWESALYDESKLFNHLKKRVYKNDLKLGSEESNNISLNDRKLIELQLLKQFVSNNPNIILIGEHALKIIINIDPTTPVIQLISQNDIESDFIEIEKIIKSSLKRNIPVVKFTRNLHIMQDFRMKRTTIKMGEEDNQKEVAYIYNSASYDLIPFNMLNTIRVGNPFVLLRFLLIDFWTIRWIKQIGGIDESFANQRLESILSKLLAFRTRMQGKEESKYISKRAKDINIDSSSFDSYLEIKDIPFRIFQSLSEDYIGIYDDEIISQKKIIKKLPKKYYDYYPFDYKKKNGTYRSIQSISE